jgi:hypothetical protein
MTLGTAAPRYASIGGFGNPLAEVTATQRFSVGCTVSNLTVSVVDVTFAPVAQSMTAGLRINNVDDLSCTISGASSCSSGGTTTIAAGDYVSFFANGYTTNSGHILRFSAMCQ